MTEPKSIQKLTSGDIMSDCCGVGVIDDWFPGKKYRTVEDIKYTCLKCHKLCKVRKEEK